MATNKNSFIPEFINRKKIALAPKQFKFSIEKLSSPNNPERKKQFLHLKKNLPQLKAFPAII